MEYRGVRGVRDYRVHRGFNQETRASSWQDRAGSSILSRGGWGGGDSSNQGEEKEEEKGEEGG